SQPDAELDTPEETPGASGKPANGKPVSGLPSTGDASMPMALGALALGLSTAFAGLMQRLRRS
ncbi:MAG: LPXTG cell wall anchor domain-containing protein, partial [Coriobacteriaceae bacterium]